MQLSITASGQTLGELPASRADQTVKTFFLPMLTQEIFSDNLIFYVIVCRLVVFLNAFSYVSKKMLF